MITQSKSRRIKKFIASSPIFIKHVSYLFLAICCMETAPLIIAQRSIPFMPGRLPLRVGSAPQET